MIEYLYDAIRAIAGQPIGITASISNDETGEPITEDCNFVLHNPDGSMLFKIKGEYIPEIDTWNFPIPAEKTADLDAGRYWYCIQHDDSNLCFKNPIYLKK